MDELFIPTMKKVGKNLGIILVVILLFLLSPIVECGIILLGILYIPSLGYTGRIIRYIDNNIRIGAVLLFSSPTILVGLFVWFIIN